MPLNPKELLPQLSFERIDHLSRDVGTLKPGRKLKLLIDLSNLSQDSVLVLSTEVAPGFHFKYINGAASTNLNLNQDALATGRHSHQNYRNYQLGCLCWAAGMV